MQLFQKAFAALGGQNQIKLCLETQTEADMALGLLVTEINRIEQKYSRYRAESVISQINRNAGKEPYKVDQETAALLDFAAALHAESEGLFDATSGVLRKAWDFKSARVPEESELKQILELVGWNKVEWKKPYLRLTLSGMELDFGGFGKEYAVDRAASMAIQAGITSGLINLGGDVRVIGPKPDGTPWMVGIKHPRQENSLLKSVALKSGALATSGDYERYFELDGKRYCHILNPNTGFPVSEIRSVSVLADSCSVAGSHSTIAMLLGAKRGRDYLTRSQLPYLIVDQSQNIHSSAI